MFIEHKMLYKEKGPVPEEEYIIPFGVADIKRPGKDVTLVTYSRMVLRALEAAEKLAKEGIDVEVIDLRTLKPLDIDTIVDFGQEDRAAGGRHRSLRKHQLHQRSDGAGERAGLRLSGCADGARRAANVPVPRAEILEDHGNPEREPHHGGLPKGGELMAEEFFIPKLGQTVEEVTLVNWLVEDGAQGQPGPGCAGGGDG